MLSKLLFAVVGDEQRKLVNFNVIQENKPYLR